MSKHSIYEGATSSLIKKAFKILLLWNTRPGKAKDDIFKSWFSKNETMFFVCFYPYLLIFAPQFLNLLKKPYNRYIWISKQSIKYAPKK